MESPFVVRNELSHPDQFYGRKDTVQEIFGFLNKSTPQNISLVGQRRIGKSFLLKYLSLCDEAQQQYLGDARKHYTFTYWDLTRHQPPTPAAFFRQLMQLIEQSLPSELQDSFLHKVADDDELDEVFEDGLDEIEAEDHHLIILLDEFESITKNTEFDENFFGQQRSFIQSSGLTYITSTVSKLSELCHSDMIANSPFFNIFTPVSLGLMPSEDIQEFAEPFAKRGISFDKGALSEIERITGGHPCILATLCDTLWRQTDNDTNITQTDISVLYDKLFEFFEPDLGYYWRHLPAKEKDAAKALIQGPINKDELGIAWRNLVDKVVAREDKNKVSLFSPLMADYLKEQETSSEVIALLFSDSQKCNENWALLMQAQLQEISSVPKEWINDLEIAIKYLLEEPEDACVRCGRRLLDKFLTAIWNKDEPARTYSDSECHSALIELNDRADDRKTKPPTFSKPIITSLWFLKNMGDCGTHNHKLTTEESILVVHTAIAVCKQLIEDGYC